MKKTYLCAAISAAMPSLDSLRAWLRNTRTGLCAIAMSLATFAQVFGQPAASVLFYGPNDSTESSFLPTSATVTVASETTWRAMTTSDFANYDLIIIGDPVFGTGPTAADLLAAYDTRNSWGAAVTGRIVVSGLDPAYHASDGHPGAGTYITATLDWLTKGPTGKTALYVSSDWGKRNLDFLSPFGAFSSSAISDANTITITSPSHPTMLGSTSASLSDWHESAHSYLTYPASFSSLATVTDGITGAVVVARDAAADIFTKVTEGPGGDLGNSWGAAWGDYDNDGFIDLFVAQSPGTSSAFQFLYHNNGDGAFSRITTGPVAEVQSAGLGAAWGDYDNDGHLDLMLANWNQPNYLFRNNGDGSFAEVPSSVSTDIIATSRGVTWVDYDNDGYVDLFRTAQINDLRRLYHNNHDGTFTRITQGDFLTVPGGFLSAAWGDYNNDGRPDLFLPQANESSGLPCYLYRNDGGGTFTRVGTGMFNHTATAAAWGDYDNDGDLDLFVSRSANQGRDGRPNVFYRNDGNGTFTSLSSLPANDPESQGGPSHGCNWGDYDNDGWLDLFVANTGGTNDFLYHNNGDGTFTKVVGDIAVSDGTSSWSAAWGDYDNDGFLDLFVANRVGANFLYHNNTNENHWLKFRLIGTRSNRAAIGAKVRVRATINGQTFWQMREVPGGDGTMGQNSLHVHIGLGDATKAEIVRVEWPSGTVQELPNVASKQFVTITEPGGEPRLAAARDNDQVQLTLTGKQGSRYAIETSTALPNWTTANLIVTITNQSGAVTFPAPGAPSGALRFYRAVWQ
jgi:ASPIC/UnbV protein/VCBS repeat protein